MKGCSNLVEIGHKSVIKDTQLLRAALAAQRKAQHQFRIRERFNLALVALILWQNITISMVVHLLIMGFLSAQKPREAHRDIQ